MKEIVIHEVGLRDGLQMEKQVVPFEQKIRWTEALIDARVDIIQLGSFVHPEKVPQMADTDKLFEYFNEPARKPANVILSGLVLNEKGLERGSCLRRRHVLHGSLCQRHPQQKEYWHVD